MLREKFHARTQIARSRSSPAGEPSTSFIKKKSVYAGQLLMGPASQALSPLRTEEARLPPPYPICEIQMHEDTSPSATPSNERSFKSAVRKAGFCKLQEADGITKLQATVRARIARERFLASKQATVKIQANVRGQQSRTNVLQLIRRTSLLAARPLASKSTGRRGGMHGSAGFNAAFASGVNLTQVMQGDSRSLKVAESIACERLSSARRNAARGHSRRLFASSDPRIAAGSSSTGTPLKRAAGSGHAETYAATRVQDGVRKALLRDARRLSPIEMIVRVDKLRHTVLLPLIKSPMAWIVVLTHLFSAIGSRWGFLSFPDLENEAFDGKASLITFMIVFYVGYVRTCHDHADPSPIAHPSDRLTFCRVRG